MRHSAAQHVLLDVPEPMAPVAALVGERSGRTGERLASSRASSGIEDDGSPPPTKTQVFYWRELAGAVSAKGSAGVHDEEWPPDLAPSKPTLSELVARHILVRRRQAWHLRRDWYARLSDLRERAVDTPPLTLADRPAPDLPTYGELERYEIICRWLDAQPTCRTRLPFAGLDTWALNWLVEEKALPPRLRMELDDHQRQAHAAEHEVETAWAYDGAPLRMYQTGVHPKNGKGVSWSYVLVNPSLRLLIRRTPLGGIAANARLGSECLWRRTPRVALDELHTLIGRLWGRDTGRWQVSYAHLAHDVANAPLEREQLDRYVSRSRRRAVYDAAREEVQRMLRAVGPQHDGVEGDLDALLFYEWEAEEGEDEELLLADAFAEDGYTWDEMASDRGPGRKVKQAQEALEEKVERRASSAYTWGQRLSGVAFSPGGPVSFVMYRKDWEGRLKGKRHMEPMWKVAGWDGTTPVTRHEARLVREPLRQLRLVGIERLVLDDPWAFLAHLQDVWAAMVGWADACPTAVDVAWLRRVVPRAGESNRSRWDTDPVWRVVQAAQFSPSPPTARRLIRRMQRQHEVKKLDQGILGYLKRREAILHPDPSGRDVSLALQDVVRPLENELARRGEQFDEAVRARRRACGLSVRVAGKVLPFRWRSETREAAAAEAYQAAVRDLEGGMPGDAEEGFLPAPSRCGDREAVEGRDTCMRRRAWLRWRSAEVGMRQAFAALEEAELRGASERELDQLTVVFEQESARAEAARAMLESLGGDKGEISERQRGSNPLE